MTEAAKLITLAKWLARKRVKERLQACGIKLEPADNRAADAYLELRRTELIAEAKAILSR
jgi:uncharacterized protein (DUF934 family)